MTDTVTTPTTAAEPQGAPVVTPAAPAAAPATATEPAAPAEPPKFVITRRGNEIITPPADPAPATPTATEPAAATDPATPAAEPAAAAAPPDEEEIEFFPYAAELTGGLIKDPESVFNLYKEHQELKKKLAVKPEIEFPNPGAKAAYEYALKHPGHEIAAMNGFYHVMSLGDVKKLSPKEAQFEAFALKYKNYPREEAREYFEAQYDRSFGSGLLESDPVAKFEHRQKTDEAMETLAKMQEDFSKVQPSQPAGNADPSISPEQRVAAQEAARKALATFGGMNYQFVDNDANSAVSVTMEDSQVQQLESWMSDPKNFLDSLTEMCTDDKGNFSTDTLGEIMFEIQNRDRIRKQTFDAGRAYGKLEIIKERKNTASPATPTTPAAPAKKPTYMEAWASAVKAQAGK
jgi:hypothetical protein